MEAKVKLCKHLLEIYRRSFLSPVSPVVHSMRIEGIREMEWGSAQPGIS
jgi:hypothetical protein